MNTLEEKLDSLNPGLFSDFKKTKEVVSKLLQQYIKNFPTYTDHSIEHTEEVLNLASGLLTDMEICALNEDEIYILCMACILHDVGMCIPEEKISQITETEDIQHYRKTNPDISTETFIRNIHHVLSCKFINEEWELLKIPSKKYATAIGLVAQGHRKIDLNDFEIYDPQFFVKTGRQSVCLPYLACIIRIADELDISNLRTPEILCKYYIPDNENSRREWEKHKATIQVNFKNENVIVEANCSDYNMLSALEEQFAKIKEVLTSCQKTIRSISYIDGRSFSLQVSQLVPKYHYIRFDPKGIKYSFEVKNVITAFVGKDLYNTNDAALREALQNAVDACNYKKTILRNDFQPIITIKILKEEISIEDNGQGMDEFIIENYFGKLASSYYSQEEIKSDFQAIGQFGIGVFSYFLISDYIDVETKRAGKNGLKFRTDQDPNGYFHFFDNYFKEEDGTKLILHLKEEFWQSYDINYIEKFVRKSFPFIGFNIMVVQDNNQVIIEPDEFIIDFDKNVTDRMYLSAHDQKSKLRLLQFYLNNDDFEGIVGLIVPAAKRFKKIRLSKLFNNNLFKPQHRTNLFSEISVSQKGVFVNAYSGRMNYLVGKINVKTKLNINLNRDGFRNFLDIMKIIGQFERGIVDIFFDKYLLDIGINDKRTLAEYSSWFVANYFGFPPSAKELSESIKTHLYFELQEKGITYYLTLEEVEERYDELDVIFPRTNDALTDKCYIKGVDMWSVNAYFCEVLQYGLCTDIFNNNYFTTLRKKQFDTLYRAKKALDKYLSYDASLTVFNNKKLIVNIVDNQGLTKKAFEKVEAYEVIRINVDHPFIIKIIENLEEIKYSCQKIFDEIFEICLERFKIYWANREPIEFFIKKINLLINNLNLNQSIVSFANLEAEDF